MLIKNVGIPRSQSWRSLEERDLDEYDIDKIPQGVTTAFYWYGEYNEYEGAGYILFNYGGPSWWLHCMGHCSCYGPTHYMENADEWVSLDQLQNEATEELWDEVSPLVALARTHEREKALTSSVVVNEFFPDYVSPPSGTLQDMIDEGMVDANAITEMGSVQFWLRRMRNYEEAMEKKVKDNE